MCLQRCGLFSFPSDRCLGANGRKGWEKLFNLGQSGNSCNFNFETLVAGKFLVAPAMASPCPGCDNCKHARWKTVLELMTLSTTALVFRSRLPAQPTHHLEKLFNLGQSGNSCNFNFETLVAGKFLVAPAIASPCPGCDNFKHARWKTVLELIYIYIYICIMYFISNTYAVYIYIY